MVQAGFLSGCHLLNDFSDFKNLSGTSVIVSGGYPIFYDLVEK